MSRPRALGTFAESAVVGYLRAHGWIGAERRSLRGRLDEGDVTGTPGLCWEVKYGHGGIRMAAWVAQTEIERINSGADFGILVIKPRGLGVKSVGRWYAVMSMPGHEALIEQATKVLDESAPVWLDPPIRFTAGALAVRLAQLHNDAGILGHGLIPAATVVPPGALDLPQMHYRAMHLADMVSLLRAAGYGDPL